jgi:sugar phosphate isomerase/epimerase
MVKEIMFVAIRDIFLTPTYGFKDVGDGLKELGLRHIEIHVDRNFNTTLGNVLDKASLNKVKNFLISNDVEVCAILLDNDFAGDLSSEIEYIVKACEVAHELNCIVVRINAFMRIIHSLTMKEYVDKTVKYVRQYLDLTRDYNVSLAMENHGYISNDREFIREVINKVSSERFGLTLDVGNFYWYGYPLNELYDIYREFAPYVKHTHIKNFIVEEGFKEKRRLGLGVGRIQGAPIYEGDINIKEVIKILHNAGYDYDLTLEDESLYRFDNKLWKDVIKKDIEHLKHFLPPNKN